MKVLFAVLVALALVNVTPAWAYNYDDIVRLSQAEQKVFGKMNTELSLDERVKAVESNLFGSAQSGSDAGRIRAICQKVGIPCPEPPPSATTASAKNSKVSTEKEAAKKETHPKIKPTEQKAELATALKTESIAVPKKAVEAKTIEAAKSKTKKTEPSEHSTQAKKESHESQGLQNKAGKEPVAAQNKAPIKPEPAITTIPETPVVPQSKPETKLAPTEAKTQVSEASQTGSSTNTETGQNVAEETEQPPEKSTESAEPPALALDSKQTDAGQTASPTEQQAPSPSSNAANGSAAKLPPGMRPPQLADQEKTNRIVLSALAMLFGITLLVAVGVIAFKATQKDKDNNSKTS